MDRSVLRELLLGLLIGSLVVGIVMLHWIPIWRRHKLSVRNAVNHTPAMTCFVYWVALPRDEILRRLSDTDETDILSCSLDLSEQKVRFTESLSSAEYTLSFQETEGGTLLRLRHASFISNLFSKEIPFKLNPFFIQKLNAEIIPYFENQ